MWNYTYSVRSHSIWSIYTMWDFTASVR